MSRSLVFWFQKLQRCGIKGGGVSRPEPAAGGTGQLDKPDPEPDPGGTRTKCKETGTR